MDALNPEQFFHGTSSVIEGGHLLPRSGPASTAGVGYGLATPYATRGESLAWKYAQQRQRMARPRVHVVSPVGPATEAASDLQAVTANSFKINDTLDIKPGHQGTFPDLNWDQFARHDISPTTDVNHPTDQEIDSGHGGGEYSNRPML